MKPSQKSNRKAQRKQWSKENRAAIDHYNKRIAQTGVFSEHLRKF